MYKKVSALLLVTAFCLQSKAEDAATLSTTAAPGKQHTFTVGVEPLWLLLGGLGASVDTRLSAGSSLELVGMYIPPRDSLTDSSNSSNASNPKYKFSVYEVYTGPKFMLTGDYDHSGVYLFPAIGYTGASISEYGTNKYGGSIDAAEARFTAGYQIVGTKDIRFTAGLGARVISSSEVVVKDGAGKEIYRTGSSALNGLALDLRVAYMF